MDMIIGTVLWLIIFYNWRTIAKVLAFFGIGFFVGYKGANPKKW